MNKEGWKLTSLAKIGTIVTGNTPKTSIAENYASADICFVKPGDIIVDGISLIKTTENYISEYARTQARVLPKGSILVTCIGVVGKVAILEEEAATNQQINSIIPKDDVDSKFIAYALYGARNTFNHIANAPVVPIINKTQFSSIEIPIPPLPIQEQIVAVLDELNNILDKKKKQLEELDTLAQTTFYDMFGDPYDNPKHWRETSLGSHLEYLGDIGSNGSNKVVAANLKMSDNEDFAIMIRTTNLSRNDFINDLKYVTEETYNFFKKSKIYGGEIIMNKIGSAGDFWLMPQLNKPVSLGLNQLVIRPKDINTIFLFYLLSTDYGKTLIKSKTRGATTKSITKSAVKELAIFTPPLPLQNQFAERIEAIEKQKELINKSIVDVQLLFDYTMDKYFN